MPQKAYFAVCSPLFSLHGYQLFIYISARSHLLKICKFCSFAYSIWLQQWVKYAPNSIFSYMHSTFFTAWVSIFHIHLCLKSSFKNILAYLHIQNGHQDGQITLERFSCPQSTDSLDRSSTQNIAVVSTFYKLLVGNIPRLLEHIVSCHLFMYY